MNKEKLIEKVEEEIVRNGIRIGFEYSKVILKLIVKGMYSVEKLTSDESLECTEKYFNKLNKDFILPRNNSGELDLHSNFFILKYIKGCKWVCLYITEETNRLVYNLIIIGHKTDDEYIKYTDFYNKSLIKCETPNRNNGLNCIGRYIIPNSFNDIIMNPVQKRNLINTLLNWKNDSDYYKRHNMKHKFGILLYGPHGTGKSSIVTAIARLLSYTIFYVDFNSILPTDLYSFTFANRVVVFEDIDRFITKNGDIKTIDGKTASIGTIMNILDGIQSSNNSIYIFTTNYKDKFNDDLIRTGRFDVTMEIGKMSKKLATKLCTKLEADPNTILNDDNDIDGEIIPSDIRSRIINNRTSSYI